MGVESVYSILNNQYSNIKKNEYSIFNIRRDKKKYSDKAAQQKAMYLANKFKNPGGIRFYLKCAWNLADEYIDWLVEYSSSKREPGKYFVKVASDQMNKS